MQNISIVELILHLGIIIIQNFYPSVLPPPKIEDVLQSTVSRNEAIVKKVVDGDTLSVLINNKTEKVRLIGIDTPETVDPRKDVECFGIEASNFMKSLLLNKKVLLESDPTQSNLDRYNRLLRYVFLPEGDFINKIMIERGYAFEYTYSQPYKYQEEFQQLQLNAQNNEMGLWKKDVCPPR